MMVRISPPLMQDWIVEDIFKMISTYIDGKQAQKLQKINITKDLKLDEDCDDYVLKCHLAVKPGK